MKIEHNDESILFSETAIPDVFFTEYLPQAPGDYIKVFLYITFISKYGKDIKFNDKFILSQNVWKIIGVDDTAKSTTTVTCEKALRNPSEDDMESGIANKSHIWNEA